METNYQNCDGDLGRKLVLWDRQLRSVQVPSYDTLIDYLCQRIVSSQCLTLVRRIVRLLLVWLLYLLGFEDAHRRIKKDHEKDGINKCWYCPLLADDRFGKRPGETILDGSILPNQVQVSYAIVIRGIKKDPSTSIHGGLGEDFNRDVADNNNLVYPDRIQNEASSPMVYRAASLLLAILKSREYYSSDKFRPDMHKGKPLTMQWYNYLFSTSLQFHRELIERYTACVENSTHVVVIHQQRLYKVELIRRDIMGDEVMPSYEEIKRQIERVIQMSSTETTCCVNPITTLPTEDRYLLEETIKESSNRNRYNFSIIRDCLLVVCLDSEDSPKMANESLYLIQSGNFLNRWYDRSVTLVVFKNGVAGFVMNYWCGITGTVASSFVELVKLQEEEILTSLQQEYSPHDQIKLKELTTPSLLKWDDTPDNGISRKLKHLRSLKNDTYPFTLAEYPSMFKLNCNVTKESLIQRAVSPSGTFHAALQLALLRMCGHPKSVFEIVSIRHLQFGGLAWMETNTADMKIFITAASEYLSSTQPENKNELKTLLLQALSSHRKNILRNKNGEIHLWHLDAIYRSLGLKTRLPRKLNQPRNLRSYLQQPVIDYLRSPCEYNAILPPQIAETFTSNPGWNPAVEAVGRVGVKSMLPLGVHYLFSEKSIAVTINSSPTHPCHGKHKELAMEIEKAFKLINELLNR